MRQVARLTYASTSRATEHAPFENNLNKERALWRTETASFPSDFGAISRAILQCTKYTELAAPQNEDMGPVVQCTEHACGTVLVVV